MIVISHGDLLNDHAEALVNTVNTEGVSGKGIALQFKLRFPGNYATYRAAAKRGEVVLGKIFAVATGLLDGPKWIVNFPTKGHWKSRSRLEDIEAGLDDLIDFARSAGITSIAVPPLGCGNGGLAWADVLPLLESKLGSLSELAVHLYPPEGAPAPETMRVATAKPRMSIGRSVLIAALDSYLQVAEGASRLVAQKLAYLLQVAGAPLRLSFEKAQYGPYAEALNFVLQAMEGHYTLGYGDRTTPSPLQLAEGAAAEADEYLAPRPELVEAVRRVGALIDGLESPYGLELLSTVHYVATEGDAPATNAKEAAVLVQEWSDRKSQLFSDDHVEVAWRRLANHGWLS
ncbi:MAG: Appr-p processing protein [Acidimicrobiaceae bacterium]|nr:Appr-p processing protein [Acidimicrobiaceae bacterium]